MGDVLLRALDEHADAPFLVHGHGGTTTRGEVRDRAEQIADEHGVALRGRAIGIPGRPTAEHVAWLVAAEACGALAVVLPRDGTVPNLPLVGTVGTQLPRPSAADAPPAPDPGVVVVSDTSGFARHDWTRLVAGVQRGLSTHGGRWMSVAPLSTFEGVRVLLHAVLGRGAWCVPADTNPAQQLADAASAGVTHVFGTPTFFRLALAMGPRVGRQWSPTQILVGGEVVDQAVLDRLRARFPSARIGHVFATPDLGPCLRVHDGRAGFPVVLLEREDRSVWMEIHDDELWVRSPYARLGDLQGSFDPLGLVATGQIVRVEGDRVHFLGSRAHQITVDGRPVHPAEVEQVLLGVPGVAAARVSGETSSLVGELPQAEVVPTPGTEAHALRDAVVLQGRTYLDPEQRPRLVRIVDDLPRTPTGALRRPEPIPVAAG